MNYYTYAYLDPRVTGIWTTSNFTFLFEPFYVGKGTGKRMYSHLKSKSKHHKTHRIADIRRDGYEPLVIQISSNVSELGALNEEHLFITELGTRADIPGICRGPLTNLKTDGAIQTYSLESRRLMSVIASTRVRAPHSQETKDKMKAAHARMTQEQREAKALKMSNKLKGKKKTPEQCERLSKLHKGKIISQEHRDKISKALTGHSTSTAVRAMISKRQQKTWTLLVENTNDTFNVIDLRGWCKTHAINYNTLHGTMKRDKFHKGYKILEREGGTHYLG